MLKLVRNWFKELRWTVSMYRKDREHLIGRIADMEAVIRERTSLHADVHLREHSQVILCGKYNGVDYVRSFSVQHSDVAHLAQMLQNLERYATIRTIDAHPSVRDFLIRQLRERP